MPEDYSWEPLSKTARVCVSRVHRFGTDAILLADFSLPRRGERCAELGAGCGVISLLWATRAAPSKVFAVELQEDAAALCRRGVEANGLSDVVETVRADLRDTQELRRHFEPGSLDRMACNPPYQSAGAGVPKRSGVARRSCSPPRAALSSRKTVSPYSTRSEVYAPSQERSSGVMISGSFASFDARSRPISASRRTCSTA